MANVGDAYMDEILNRKLHKELDESLRPGTIQSFWERLKTALQSEVEIWNQRCGFYQDAENDKIRFYLKPFLMEAYKEIAEGVKDGPAAEVTREWLKAPSFGGVPMLSVCAETVGKNVVGRSKARVFVWLTQVEPYRIMYSYGERCDYNNATELPLRLEAGAMVFENGLDVDTFTKREARRILLPLMEA